MLDRLINWVTVEPAISLLMTITVEARQRCHCGRNGSRLIRAFYDPRFSTTPGQAVTLRTTGVVDFKCFSCPLCLSSCFKSGIIMT